MNDIAKLPISEVQNLNISPSWQRAFYLIDPRPDSLFAVYKAGIDRKLTTFLPLIQQKVTEVTGGFALRFGLLFC